MSRCQTPDGVMGSLTAKEMEKVKKFLPRSNPGLVIQRNTNLTTRTASPNTEVIDIEENISTLSGVRLQTPEDFASKMLFLISKFKIVTRIIVLQIHSSRTRIRLQNKKPLLLPACPYIFTLGQA